MGYRQAVLRVSVDLFIEFLKHRGEPRTFVIEDGALPDDAQFVRVGYDNTGQLLIVLESSRFEEIGRGEPLPYVSDPAIRVVREATPA